MHDEVIFRNIIPDSRRDIEKLEQYIAEILARLVSSTTSGPAQVKWTKPEMGWIKVNVDGAALVSGCMAHAGGVARNHLGGTLGWRIRAVAEFGFSSFISLLLNFRSIWTVRIVSQEPGPLENFPIIPFQREEKQRKRGGPRMSLRLNPRTEVFYLPLLFTPPVHRTGSSLVSTIAELRLKNGVQCEEVGCAPPVRLNVPEQPSGPTRKELVQSATLGASIPDCECSNICSTFCRTSPFGVGSALCCNLLSVSSFIDLIVLDKLFDEQ
ncbi:hypothetical protein HHK36_000345 [Tetracentron sinense]|uniref:Uncharacterized protein n=1 Tax=Tetracentron sinense TaxID=13715 RepID=A0A835DQP9_TETSI|nr:hypothetical protein HHK36_000345 [Tetracentron sinense]